jgi:hypothetical protein
VLGSPLQVSLTTHFLGLCLCFVPGQNGNLPRHHLLASVLHSPLQSHLFTVSHSLVHCLVLDALALPFSWDL